MEKKLGFGIIGCGFISNHHAQAILHTEGACLIGATDVNEQNAEAFCKKFGITHFQLKFQLRYLLYTLYTFMKTILQL